MKIFIKKMSLLLASLILSALVAEIGLRACGPAWLHLRMRAGASVQAASSASDRNWRMVRSDGVPVAFEPGHHFWIDHSEYSHSVQIDSAGCRRVPAGQPITKDGPIAFLGDSYVFGVGVEDSETLPSLLAQAEGVSILNCGIPGSSMGPQIACLKARWEEWGKPRRVAIGVYLGNDLRDNVKRFALERGESRSVAADGEVQEDSFIFTINDWMSRSWLRESYLAQFSKSILRSVIVPKHHNVEVWSCLTAREAEMRRAAEKYASDLTEFIQEHSLSVMAVLIPSQIQLDADYADGLRISNGVSADGFEPSLPRKIAREALDSVGVPYIDACESMADAYTPDMFYVRDAHMTPLGMRALMRCVRPEFKEWCR